jgi:hypothetical protein
MKKKHLTEKVLQTLGNIISPKSNAISAASTKWREVKPHRPYLVYHTEDQYHHEILQAPKSNLMHTVSHLMWTLPQQYAAATVGNKLATM